MHFSPSQMALCIFLLVSLFPVPVPVSCSHQHTPFSVPCSINRPWFQISVLDMYTHTHACACNLFILPPSSPVLCWSPSPLPAKSLALFFLFLLHSILGYHPLSRYFPLPLPWSLFTFLVSEITQVCFFVCFSKFMYHFFSF